MQRNRLANFLPYLVVILAIVSLWGLNLGASSERISYYELQNVIEKKMWKKYLSQLEQM